MRTDELDFELPSDLIATTPAEPRDAARLMVIDRATGQIQHKHIRDLPTLGVLRPDDLLVFNRTRVLPAYLTGTRIATGGRVTGLFVDQPTPGHWHVMLETRGKLQVGERIELGEGQDRLIIALDQKLDRGAWLASLPEDATAKQPAELLEHIGGTPLPPYIRKARRSHDLPEETPSDRERYNTTFASDDVIDSGSVAAPTAGLHFTPALLDALEQSGVRRAEVTLQVGLGTFLPVQSETLEEHPIHHERIHVERAALDALRATRQRGGRVIPVGTTSVRTLESLPDLSDGLDEFNDDTGLFITPGFEFRFADGLLTNFHLPRSTLLALVSALPGVDVDRLLGWYREAIAQGYRFYSYGDAMMIL